MPLAECIVNGALRTVISVVCRVDRRELDPIPMEGPAILVTNHSTNLEGPIYYVLLDPRRKTALGKRELWENWVTRFFMQLWGVIPLHRGGPDRRALRKAREALDRGELLGIAPEGTRSRTGTLQRGRPGAALLATSAEVPIVPMVQWGVQDLLKNLRRLRRTTLHFRVGAPFFLRVPEGGNPSRDDLRKMADEIMYQLAILLPESLRGYYRDLTRMTHDYIRLVEEKPVQS
jgi:1-acyl-sn-glycerol-3-phosphate acyltransferase